MSKRISVKDDPNNEEGALLDDGEVVIRNDEEIETRRPKSSIPRIQSPKPSPQKKWRLLAAASTAFIILIIGQYLFSYQINEVKNQYLEMTTVDPLIVLKHVKEILHIGNTHDGYENGRSVAREYIRDQLLEGGFGKDQVLWHTFEWSEKKANGRNITTITWTGINIVVWTNTTAVPLTKHKLRIFGAHYDTKFWAQNGTSGAHDNLAGTGLLMELAIKINNYQKKRLMEDPTFEEIPYMFVFFDQEEPGALGSKTFVDYYRIGRNSPYISYFIDIDSIGYASASPIVQTYPYEDKGKTLFTPRGLASAMLQAAFHATEDGMTVGHPSLINSVVYQAVRYHLISIPYLSDDGPFTWNGVQSLLFTDLELFFEGNPHYHKITDQITNLSVELLQNEANILAYFALATEDENLQLHQFAKSGSSGGVFKKLAWSFIRFLKDAMLAGSDHYIAVGPFSFGFLELMALSMFLIYVVFETSLPAYRQLTFSLKQSGNENSFTKLLNHRILFFHLAALTGAVIFDTAYAFVIICCGFPALVSIYINRVNIVTSFISSLLCFNLLLMDIYSMIHFGRKGPKAREMKLAILITIYVCHSLLVLAYGWDFYIKSKLKRKQQ